MTFSMAFLIMAGITATTPEKRAVSQDGGRQAQHVVNRSNEA